MKISGDMAVKLALGVAVIGAVFYATNKIKKGVSDLVDGALDYVPDTVIEGIDAAWQLGQLGANIVVSPLDTFGALPGGGKGWSPTVPWKSDDPVSNNDAGINYNYF